MGQHNLINPPALFSIPRLGPSHTPSCTLVLSEESLEPYLRALSVTLRPCFGHSLNITYLVVSLQYLVHPCPSHTFTHSPWSTVYTTSGKYNRFFHPHASVLTTELESFNSSKPKSTLSIWKNDVPNSSSLIWKQSMLKNSNNKTETNFHSTEATWNHSRHTIHKRSLYTQAFLKNKQYER